jgi:cytochrome P450
MSSQPTGGCPIHFDPYDHHLQDDPYPTYARLRVEAPLFHEEEHDFWVISRHEDINRAFRADGPYSNRMGVVLDESAWNRHAHTVMSFLAMDPPQQTRLRKLVSAGFTPRRVAGMTDQIQRITDLYLDRCLADAAPGGTVTFDWITDFAGRVPMDVISEMLGVPAADRDEVRRLADLLVLREDGLRDIPRAGMEASMTLFDYFRGLVEHHYDNPGDDLVSALLNAEIEGDRMTDDEVIAFLFLMVVAGNETTTKLLGNAMFHLTQHPEQLQRVFADPTLITALIEETLRHDTSSQMLARLTLEDVTIEDVTMPAGSKVLFNVGAANHDERVFTDPERFDIDRPGEELKQIVSFGGGRHFCLGANLARLEARLALAELVRRVAAVEVDHEGCRRFYSANVRGFASVPMTVTMR